MDTQMETYWLKASRDEMTKTEVKAGAAIARETMAEMGSGRETEIASLKTELKTDTAIRPICENLRTESSSLPEDIQSEPPSDSHSGEDTKPGDPSAKPSLSYIALIAKVILSSSSQKLNLASIYREMEEQFPYFRSRGQGWRNSVRHNLSLNDCFVKVSRCEDGKGHYWGIHPAHLGDFLLGDFRQHRKARRSRQQREMQGRVAGSFGWAETHCNWERLCGSGLGPLGLVEPQCPLREPKQYQAGSVNWAGPHNHLQGLNGGGVGSLGWLRPYYCPERFQNSYNRAGGRWCYNHSVTPTWRLHSWQMHDPTMSTVEGSYNSMLVRPHSFYSPPGCQYRSPVFKDMI